MTKQQANIYIKNRRINSKVAKQLNQEFDLDIKEDTFNDKLRKYVPITIVTTYMAMREMIIAAFPDENQEAIIYFKIIFLLCLVAVPLYKIFVVEAKLSKDKISWYQAFISTAIYVVWVYSLGDWFKYLHEDYNALWGGLGFLALLLYIPIFDSFFLKGDDSIDIGKYP